MNVVTMWLSMQFPRQACLGAWQELDLDRGGVQCGLQHCDGGGNRPGAGSDFSTQETTSSKPGQIREPSAGFGTTNTFPER